MVARNNDNTQREVPTTYGASPEALAKMLEMGFEDRDETPIKSFKDFFKRIGIRLPTTEQTSTGRQYAIMDAFFDSCTNYYPNTREFTPIEEEIVTTALEHTNPRKRAPELILSNEELRTYCNLWKEYEEKFTQATKKYHDITNAMRNKK